VSASVQMKNSKNHSNSHYKQKIFSFFSRLSRFVHMKRQKKSILISENAELDAGF
jgi:hypothetical protein